MRGRVIALVSALGLLASLDGPSSAKAAEPPTTRIAVADGVSVALPAGLTYERKGIPAGAELVVITDGGDVLAIVTYRERAERPAPSVEQALATHAGELADLLGLKGENTTDREGVTLLGRPRPTARLLRRAPAKGPAHEALFSGPGVDSVAWVVAAEHEAGRGRARVRRVVVASALIVVGSPNAAPFERIIESLAVK